MDPDFPDDSVITDRLQKGELVAFDMLFQRYSAKLYYFAYRYLRCREESSELVQNVFLKLWENHKNLKKEASIRSFMFTIAYNEICTLFRRRICLQKYFDHIRLEKNQISFETEEKIDCNSLIERLDQIIKQLPEKQKSIFIKSRIEGKSSRSIADELGLSSGTIDNYISKILKIINEKLTENI